MHVNYPYSCFNWTEISIIQCDTANSSFVILNKSSCNLNKSDAPATCHPCVNTDSMQNLNAMHCLSFSNVKMHLKLNSKCWFNKPIHQIEDAIFTEFGLFFEPGNSLLLK